MRRPLLAVAGMVLAAAFSFPGSVSAQAPAAALTGQSQFDRGSGHGRRARQRHQVRLEHHGHRRFRRGWPLQLPVRQARTRTIYAERARDRLRARSAPSGRGSRSENRDAGSQARQDQGPRRAIVERRMAGEHPRHRPAEGSVCSTASAATRSNASCARNTTARASSPEFCRACRAMCSRACRSIRNCAPPSA